MNAPHPGDVAAVRSLAEMLPQLVLTGDAAGTWAYANARWRSVTGRAPEGLVGDGWHDLVHPEDRAPLLAAWAEAMREGREHAGSVRLRLRTGAWGVFVAAVRPIPGEDAPPQGWIAVFDDRAERERFTRRVLDQLSTFVGLLALDGTLLEVNSAPLEAAGLTPEDVLGKKFWEGAWWTHDADVVALVRDACRRAAAGERVRFDVPIRVHAGDAMWLDFQVAPLRDAAGRVTHLVPSAVDITARRATAAALRASERRLSRLFETHLIGILYWDMHGRVHGANDEFLRIVGYTREELASGRVNWIDMTPVEYKDQDARAVDELRRVGVHAPLEKEYVRKDGSRVWVLVGSAIIEGDHGVGFILDIEARKRAEAALRASEERYRTLFESIDEGFCLVRVLRDDTGKLVDYVYVEANAAYERHTGLVGVVGRRALELMPEMRRDTAALLERVLSTGVGEHFERWFAPLERWFDVYMNRVGPPDRGEIAVVLADVTERKRAEQALRESEARAQAEAARAEAERALLDAILDAAPVGIIMAGPGGEILRTNTANGRLWGETPPTGSVEEYASWKGWWADDSSRAGQPVAPDEWAMARALRGEAVEHIVSIEPFGAPGARRTMLNSGAPVRDGAGNVIGGVVAQMDISERLKVEQELRERERRLRYTLEATRTVAWTWSPETGRVQRSGTAMEVLGLAPEGTLDEWLAVVHPDERERFASDLARAVAGEGPFEFECRFVHPVTGVERWAFVRGMLEPDATGVVRMSGLATDVTERRSAEAQVQAAQRIEAIGRLAGGVAHEINNALSGVIGFAGLALRRLPAGDPVRVHVEQIARAGDRAAAVTRQLLAFGRRQVLQTRDVDVCGVIDRFEPMLRQALGADKTFRFVRCDRPAVAHADPGQLEQVLLNLALNARDAMAYGGTLEVAVTVERLGPTRPKELTGLRPGPWVCVRVTDDGTGMDDEVRAHLFEPFFTTKPVGQGSGLGLATVYGIVQQSNGHIAVTSAPGAGTTFRILLPEVAAPAAAASPGVRAPAVLERPARILVVDDEPLVLDAMACILREEGCDVVAAGSVKEALARADGHWDLVICDLVMPGQSGAELARSLRATHPRVPLLFVSGYTDDEAIKRGLLPDGARLLQKPFEVDVLLARVSELIGPRRPR